MKIFVGILKFESEVCIPISHILSDGLLWVKTFDQT